MVMLFPGLPSASDALLALGWLSLMLAYSPVADLIGRRVVGEPPRLATFRGLQQDWRRFLMGILVAWALGGFLEEIVFRGIVLQWIEALLTPLLGWIGVVVAVCAAAFGAGVVHLYQGPRGALIVGQLSVLFGVLYVVSGHDIWAVVLCHGLYDTIAFVRFARKESRYSRINNSATDMTAGTI